MTKIGAAGPERDTVRSAQSHPSQELATATAAPGLKLETGKLTDAKRGFAPLPSGWVVGRFFAWSARFRGLARDEGRLPEPLGPSHGVPFACLMLSRITFRFHSR